MKQRTSSEQRREKAQKKINDLWAKTRQKIKKQLPKPIMKKRMKEYDGFYTSEDFDIYMDIFKYSVFAMILFIWSLYAISLTHNYMKKEDDETRINYNFKVNLAILVLLTIMLYLMNNMWFIIGG